ncbi:hypothetical protein [Tropicibacter oceani]|uniref:Uncharacterized protein n=1 Tax=Tropicibacter oceani TaxID=3058420 RepID=A0ABY8QDZ2_9RHOB|nr:hypothetical protein [Tropicibacter oceani]WGW02725.1 hypothetical protein QF118_12335 [Tropicibacter oceani]
MKGDHLDPKGLIMEAYNIEGIQASECRSIFLDWALSVPADVDTAALIGALLARYGEAEPADHPMTQVLREGLDRMGTPKRRGGYKSRPRD